jgi:site-specific recombinase XerD
MKKKQTSIYSPPLGESFIATCHYNGVVRPQEREKIRSIQVLNDMLQLGYIRKVCRTPIRHELNGEIGTEMEKLVAHITNLRRSKTTINDYRLYLSEFLAYLTDNEVRHVNDITENHLICFIMSHPTNKTNVVSALRVLFRFWKSEKITSSDFKDLFDGMNLKRHERIPSFFTDDEVMTIENSIARSSKTGKRNYAMVLLASRLGLRASDIAGLQFSDIDWDKNTITLIMKKTKKVIELPLLTDVGNAIIDYLRYGRPKSNLQNVFISTRAPYVAATKEMVCAAIDNIICESGIDIVGKHHGPHSLRHSLASTMLKNGTGIQTISETLGHRSTETTLMYLKIDIKSLLMCALPVPPVPSDFYNQRGGAFYG